MKKTSYQSIDTQTRIGAVRLKVADLERSIRFYQDSLALQLHQRQGQEATLGVGSADLLQLQEQAGARPTRGTTGLYHFAVLVPSRLELARSLRRLAVTQTPLQGFADHLVSEAIYLADPDGNGIEIYRDRPREQWPHKNGELQMATDPLDVDGVMAELSKDDSDSGLAPETTIGHIHLHVADEEKAADFYVDILGFELIQRYGPSAVFVAAGGYHHHIGLNTWAGAGAPPPPPEAAGLAYYEIILPDAASLDPVRQRLDDADWPYAAAGSQIHLQDPSENKIVLTPPK